MYRFRNGGLGALVPCVDDVCNHHQYPGYFYYSDKDQMVSDYALPLYDAGTLPDFNIDGSGYYSRQYGKDVALCQNLRDVLPSCASQVPPAYASDPLPPVIHPAITPPVTPTQPNAAANPPALQPTLPLPTSAGFTLPTSLSDVPVWMWAAGAGVALFAFGGGGGRRR